MNEFFKLVADLGFPIAAAITMGYFIFLVMKFILAGVMSNVKGLSGIITALDNRVKTMNHDVVRIDTLMSNALGVKPDVDRIARADGKNDARRD
jgi:archaellum biogenesis ATPase FlaH